MLHKKQTGTEEKRAKNTPVAIVKDQLEFKIDGGGDILPVCFNGDAGGGKFVAQFTFLNRKDKALKLHPFILYECTDDRENLQRTLAQHTQETRKLEGSKI